MPHTGAHVEGVHWSKSFGRVTWLLFLKEQLKLQLQLQPPTPPTQPQPTNCCSFKNYPLEAAKLSHQFGSHTTRHARLAGHASQSAKGDHYYYTIEASETWTQQQQQQHYTIRRARLCHASG